MKKSDAEEFYRHRDDRTNRSTGAASLEQARVQLSIDVPASETFAGQFCYLTLANLLARWCRTVSVAPNSIELRLNLFPWLEGPLASAACQLMKQCDPFGHFEVEDSKRAVHLHVGSEVPDGAYAVAGHGWIAETGSKVQRLGTSANPIGPALAACLGCCYAMQSVLSLEVPESLRFSAYNLQAGEHAVDGPEPNPSQINSLLLVGCGAVGAGIAYLLPFMSVTIPRLVLIDGDAVDVTNLNRVPLFFFEDAGLSRLKTDLVAEYLGHSDVRAEIMTGRFADAVRGSLKTRLFDVVVPAANEDGVHAAIQQQCPPLMIYGTTGPNWDAYLHRHIPMREDCLACRFPSARPLPGFGCAKGSLSEDASPPEEAEFGVLPFLSLTAATLAAAEIMKLALPNYPTNENYAIVQFNGADLHPMRVKKSPSLCGHCWSRAVWTKLGINQQFASLSTNADPCAVPNHN